VLDPISMAGERPAQNSRTVSRELKLQAGFLGIDSMYVVMEYPKTDVYEFWSSEISDFHDPRLHEGIPFSGALLRRGAHGYKLAVWDGDARLFVTDRVNDVLEGTPHEGHGMGLMLQLGPKWLVKYGNVHNIDYFQDSILAQFAAFAVARATRYPIRLNRIDIALDVVGLDITSLSIEEWINQWVGYAPLRDVHYAPKSGQLQGFSIGSSSGAIRFKAYDKVAQSIKIGASGFWRSVWRLDASESVPVTRFEWSCRPYAAKFANFQYMSDLKTERIFELMNYASYKWGRLCIPNPDDSCRTRWELAPLWIGLHGLIEEWASGHQEYLSREYDFTPDLKEEYVRAIAGWLSGFQARVGINSGKEEASSRLEAFRFLRENGFSINAIQDKAQKKWQVYSALKGE
jgi:hypothetical protein